MPNFFTNLTRWPSISSGLIGDPVGLLGGLNGPGQQAFQPWNVEQYWRSDWTRVKMLLTPDLRKDREVMTTSAVTPRRIVYGTCRTSGQLAYVETSGDNNANLHLILLLASHPVTGFGDIYLDEKLISTFGDKAQAVTFDGTQTEACAEMVAVSAEAGTIPSTVEYSGNVVAGVARIGMLSSVIGIFAGMTVTTPTGTGIPVGTTVTYVGDGYVDISNEATATEEGKLYQFTGASSRWTENHKLLGQAYIYLKLTYDEALYPSGIPTIKVVIHGKQVYDPRTATVGYSSNPAICALDYMLLMSAHGGMGCSMYEISKEHVKTAADICDEQVSKNLGGTVFEKRYQCHGTIDLNGTPKQILDCIMQSMIGTAIYSEGVWKLYAGAYTEPVATLDESWLSGPITFNTGASKSDKLNTVRGDFVDPTDGWAIKQFPVLSSTQYINEDGGEELAIDLTLNFTTSPTCAQRIAKIVMEKARLGQTITYPCNFKAFKLEPNDNVYVNNTKLGWHNRIFKVVDWQFSEIGGINLQLAQDDPNVYNWTSGDVIPIILPPSVNLPIPQNVTAPTILTVNYFWQPYYNLVNNNVTITWSTPESGSSSNLSYNVFIDGIIITNIRGNSYTFTNVTVGEHTFGVQTVNSFGANSSTSTVIYAVPGKTDPPNAPLSVNASVSDFFITLTVESPGDFDLASFVIRKGSSWESGIEVARIDARSNTYVYAATESGDYQFFVKSLNTSALYSDLATASPIVNVHSNIQDIRSLTWLGSITNCVVEQNKLIAPVNISELFEDHFNNNSWSSPQDQINAGKSLFIQSGNPVGQYVEEFDYGSVFNGKLSLSLSRTNNAGTVNVACTISIKELIGDAWTDYNGFQATVGNFKYVKITLDFTTSDSGVVTISGSELKLQ